MNITIDRKKVIDCGTTGWHRDDSLGKANLSSYYGTSPPTTKIDQQQQQQQHYHQQQLSHHQINAHVMYNTKYGYNFQSPTASKQVNLMKDQTHHQISIQQRSAISNATSSLLPVKRKLPSINSNKTSSTTASASATGTGTTSSSYSSNSNLYNLSPNNSNSNMPSSSFRHHVEFSRNVRADVSLVPPIRQTASIFKQPVTVYKTQDTKVKYDLKHGILQDKPKQLFWEKRLEGLRACDITGTEFNAIDLPKTIKSCGPNVNEQTLLQSVATALHVSNYPVTGQTASKAALQANSGVFINPEQPLMYLCTISDNDIQKQEDRVNLARRRLQDALKG